MCTQNHIDRQIDTHTSPKAEQRKMEILMYEKNVAKGKSKVSTRQTLDIKS